MVDPICQSSECIPFFSSFSLLSLFSYRQHSQPKAHPNSVHLMCSPLATSVHRPPNASSDISPFMSDFGRERCLPLPHVPESGRSHDLSGVLVRWGVRGKVESLADSLTVGDDDDQVLTIGGVLGIVRLWDGEQTRA